MQHASPRQSTCINQIDGQKVTIKGLGVRMVSDVIPNFEQELKQLSVVAPAGWNLAFNYRWNGPEHMFVGFSDAWRAEYETKNYAIGDPIFLWIVSRDNGCARWSEVKTPDLRGVMEKARRHQINYGMVFTRHVNGTKSFLSMARSDREFTDEELSSYNARFNLWVDLLVNRADLTGGEIAVLRCFRDGLGQAETAASLGISESTVKQRFVKICAKLNANTRTQAVATAVARNYLT